MGIYGVDFYGTTFYGAPLYLEFDARPFTATPVGYGSVRLDWVNPEGDWDRMRVLRSSYGYPDYHEDGVLILEKGSEAVTSVVDHTVKPGKFFYYTVWVRETENQVWVRAADVIALPTADHQYGGELYSFMPAWLQEADDDRTSTSQPDGPLRRYLDVFGRMLDHIRTEYDTLMWTRDPEKISGNLLRLFAQQYGIPHEPALGMRQTRVWLRDAVYLYRTKGTRPGVEAAASAITGWGARVTFSKNLLRGGGKFGWYPGAVGPDINDAFAPDDPNIAVLRVSWTTSSWSMSTAPSDFDVTLPHWFRLHVMPGMDYTASCSIRPAVGVAGGIPHRWRITWFDHDGQFLSVEEGDFVNSEANKWVPVRSTFNAPMMADCGVLAFQSGSGAPVASDIYIRHAQFEQSPLATPWVEPRAVVVNFDPVRWNYVPNPVFENGMFGWFIREGTASVVDSPISGFSGKRVILQGAIESEKMGVATAGVPHVFSGYVEGASRLKLKLSWYQNPGDEDPVMTKEEEFESSGGTNRFSISSGAPHDAIFANVDIEGEGIDGTALELEGTNSYASTTDVNRLRAHLAHLTSVNLGALTHDNAGVEEEWRARQVSGSIVADASLPMGGKYIRSERLTTDWQTDWGVHHLASASIGQTITFSAFTRAGPGANARVGIACLNAGGGSELTFSGSPTTNSSWTRVSATVTVPANTVSVRLLLQPGAGESYADFHSMCLRVDASSVFVPSHRITGDLDVRVKLRAESLAVTEWYPLALVNRAVFGVDFSGRMKAWAAKTAEWDGFSSVSSTVPLPSPLSPNELRWVVVPNNGSGAWEVSFYYRTDSSEDWTQLGTTRVGPASSSFSIRNVGNVFRTGIFNPNPNYTSPSVHFYGEARDGIDGPIAARFDATSAPWEVGDSAPVSRTDDRGHVWTLFGSANIIENVVPVPLGNMLFEEGSVPGDYFDGSRFGADWLWAGVPHASVSKYYPSRSIRNVRVRELLPHYLPLNQVFLLNYVGGAPPSGRAVTGDEGNVGVGTYGIMPFGQ